MQPDNETQKVALITGASSGIGEACVRLFLKHGWRVNAGARERSDLLPLETLGASIYKIELTDESTMRKAVDSILETEGRLDVLINNAGTGVYGPVETVSLERAREQFEVNLFGLARLTQLILPAMREQGSGKIVNLSSVGGKSYTPLGAWYHASKHALEAWSDCLRFETRPFGIDVIIIEPGAIQTEFSGNLVEPMLKCSSGTPYETMASSMARATERTFQSGKATPPEKVAGVIRKAILAHRPKTRYVTGHLGRTILTARKILPDRLFDWLIRKFL